VKSNIYIIGTETPPYKIGFSKTPEKRLKSLQTGHPTKLSLHYVKEIPDTQVKNIEKQIHKAITYKRTKGEWFNILLEDAISEVNFAVIKYEKI
jgi:hypothetical protein